ncbi:MAG TPA: DUF4249 family protein, partial [Salinimicrobium sp.]|nr:DUF4249 family protein [Salinimicrobium sp.]
SVMPFQAVPERNYQLFITSEGTEYESTPQVLPTQTELENIVVVPKTVDGVEGLEIQANSFDPSGNSKYYRYEYEETYKVIAEYWSQYKVLVLSPASLDYMETDEYKKICYATKSSATALLKSTQDLVEDRVQDFPVKFIPKTDGTISHRYSILVTQYVMNLEAFNFHQTHHNIYGGGTTLSPVQPGFIRGNISAIGSDKKVVGLFDVASESSKRIFFSYADFYSGELPDPFECEIEILNSADFNFTPPPADGMTIINYTENNKMLLYDVVGDEYYMVPLECGDCSTVGSPVVPEFWEE